MIQTVKAEKVYEDGRHEDRDTAVLKEHVLTVLVNETPAFRLVCTKSDLRELITGRLYTEGLIEKAEDIHKIYFCRSMEEASVFLNYEPRLEGNKEAEPSCCAGNIAYLSRFGGRPLKNLNSVKPDPSGVFQLADRFFEGTRLHRLTQGTHSCFLEREGELLYSCEDIGRHNAVDKAVGYGVLNGVLFDECMLFTSGRIPVDMVQKVIAAGIPVLVTKSVPTAESIALSKQYGLTLIGRAHRDSYEVY